MIIISCTKTDDSPVNTETENLKKTAVPVDSLWFAEYERLVFTENYLLELIASGSIDERELDEIDASLVDSTFSIEQLRAYLTTSEYDGLLAYCEELNSYFLGVSLTAFDLAYIRQINVQSISQWSGYFPGSEVVLAKAGNCEEEAARDAVNTLGTFIAGGAGTALFTGGTSIVAGVVGGVVASVVTWSISISACP